MPELPEVETIRRSLEREVLNLQLRDLEVHEPRLLQNCTEKELKRALIGNKVGKLGRRAKFLIFDFGKHSIVFHLRMTGWFSLDRPQKPRLILKFDRKTLYFEDTRRFGTLHLTETKNLSELQPLAQLGIEPFHPSYTLKNFRASLQSPQEIKRSLLDQTKIAGLGNIYACEALFASKIHPERSASSLSAQEVKRLFTQIEKMLERAISEQGTTVDTYRSLDGVGNFQNFLAVYDRENQPCIHCKATIERLEQGGRSSYCCPKCQK
ncbi:bifunctional DNA-formamidopyrimidine glycosylase/DNA-(apurinic or apyrimidinic site) lyase [Candidatus Acetothermia bacterium]|nr:bifunctional DNA-formamidopyrimidine glycosylase/DNA-(apurinic or apyrimidinic site) lyase [Candidatus Acetothermia bacterium]MBI3660475.1 bifunctional DNA-formamidopyrimidine glycosylase/DNA-(apurinic or apyrimidinic site) lyase [Candidatus Acetothermia bacterium]